MKTVYLAGGINGLSDADAKDWREHAKSILHARGFVTLDPMRRDYRGVEAQHVRDIVHGDLNDIDACDIVLAMCPRPSWGTAMEIMYAATEAGKEVIAVCSDPRPSPWLSYHARVFTTLDAAIDAIT